MRVFDVRLEILYVGALSRWNERFAVRVVFLQVLNVAGPRQLHQQQQQAGVGRVAALWLSLT